MFVVFLLFLTIPVVSSADPKCPKGFNHFKRVPTAKNNHTKDWCLGIFKFENMGDRDRARSFCIHHDAMLSIPENKKEYDALSKIAKSENISEPHAMDGEISPRCKARFFQSQKAHKKLNVTTIKGECNIKNRLYIFDDTNTDPSFVLQQPPYIASIATKSGSDPSFRRAAECLTLINTNYKGNQTDYKVSRSSYCNGPDKPTDMNSVICGRRPL